MTFKIYTMFGIYTNECKEWNDIGHHWMCGVGSKNITTVWIARICI